MENSFHYKNPFLTQTEDYDYYKQKKIDRNIFLVKKYLKRRRSIKPFDGMATNRKKLTIIDYLNEANSPLIKGKNYLFEEHFPLLNVISNRKALNYSKGLLPDMLSNPSLSQTEENIIANKSFRKNIYNSKGFHNDTINNALQNDLMKYSKNERNMSIQTIKSEKPKFENNSLSKIFSESYRRLKDDYRKKNLKFHRINGENQENMKIKYIDNYILNGYKTKKKDILLDILRADAMKLKFNNSLRVCSNLV